MQTIARHLLRRRTGCLIRVGRTASSGSKPKQTSAVSLRIDNLPSSEIPIEKRSLSRGLAMNKFEKDFMIYPEYTDTDDLRTVEGFTKVLRDRLKAVVDEHDLEKAGELSPEVLAALTDSSVYGLNISTEFGGVGMSYKDLMRVQEELSIDWSIFSHSSVSYIASNLLLLYGSVDQKEKYLPMIASGQCRPGVAFAPPFDSEAESSEVVGHSSSASRLLAKNIRVLNGKNANLLFVFAVVKNSLRDRSLHCYLIDITKLKDGEKFDVQREETLGLRALDIGRLSLDVSLTSSSLLTEEGRSVSEEIPSCVSMPFGAAVVGYGKRVLGELATIANETSSTTTPMMMISCHSHVQRMLSGLSTRLYALESVIYYLAGLLDEKLPVVVDVENAIVQRLSRDFLRQSMLVTTELLGLRAADSRELHQKHARDVATLMAIFGEGDSVEEIAMSTLSAWAAKSMTDRPKSTLSRLFQSEKTMRDLRDPTLQHYIAEHAHPSLQMACQELEYSMVRLDAVLKKLMVDEGKQLETDYGSLERLTRVIQNNLVMVCVISRASRSYSIGLRHCEVELAWATSICSQLSRQSWFELDALSDYFGLVRLNPSLLNAGRAVLDWNGYQIESPLERNW